ncbi:putative ERGIC-53 like protein [Blattamonas nauphoetae]|uniref:ERGIC-53 like protein n=1 Tax=Blattamonas nauphoetae TaxID=2049346 RepID=A0ABQ9XVY0_9EUKA|nr:putative ERGIC-53 like protein [Blattamonas nauphoetae]
MLHTCLLSFFVIPLSFSLSLKGPFLQGRPDGSDDWVLGGTASIMTDRIRLTNLESSQKGIIWTGSQNRFVEWEANFEIQVFGGKQSGADGMAFWYARDPQEIGDVYGSRDQWTGLSVIFDTYDNRGKRQNPSVLAVLNNGTFKYDHDNDGVTQQSAGVGLVKFRRDSPFKVRVIYANRTLSVATTISIGGVSPIRSETITGAEDDDKTQYTTCFVADSIDLPIGYYFGFSAATGGLTDNHDIISFDLTPVQHRHPPPSPKQSGPIDPTSSTTLPPPINPIKDDKTIPPLTQLDPVTSSSQTTPPTIQTTSSSIDLSELQSLKNRLSSLSTQLEALTPSATALQQKASQAQPSVSTAPVADDAAKMANLQERATKLKESIKPGKTPDINEVSRMLNKFAIPSVPTPPSDIASAVSNIKSTFDVVQSERKDYVRIITEGVTEQVDDSKKASKMGAFRLIMYSLIGTGAFLMVKSQRDMRRHRQYSLPY